MAYGSPVLLLVAATESELCGHEGLVCGVGPVEAAAATARALALRKFGAVLNVGLAGGRGLDAGTIVIGTESLYRDLAAEWPVVDRAGPDQELVDLARATLPDAVACPIQTSAAVGGARDTASQGRLVEAMEGFGVLRAAELARVPAVEVRAISNEIGESDRTRWQLDLALAALAEALPRLLVSVRARGS